MFSENDQENLYNMVQVCSLQAVLGKEVGI